MHSARKQKGTSWNRSMYDCWRGNLVNSQLIIYCWLVEFWQTHTHLAQHIAQHAMNWASSFDTKISWNSHGSDEWFGVLCRLFSLTTQEQIRVRIVVAAAAAAPLVVLCELSIVFVDAGAVFSSLRCFLAAALCLQILLAAYRVDRVLFLLKMKRETIHACHANCTTLYFCMLSHVWWCARKTLVHLFCSLCTFALSSPTSAACTL